MKRIRVTTALYRALMCSIELRRRELGLAQWQVDDKAGVADRCYPKLLWSDTPSGRQGQLETLQDIVDALWPDGFKVLIVSADGSLASDVDLRAALDAHSRYDIFSRTYRPVPEAQSADQRAA